MPLPALAPWGARGEQVAMDQAGDKDAVWIKLGVGLASLGIAAA